MDGKQEQMDGKHELAATSHMDGKQEQMDGKQELAATSQMDGKQKQETTSRNRQKTSWRWHAQRRGARASRTCGAASARAKKEEARAILDKYREEVHKQARAILDDYRAKLEKQLQTKQAENDVLRQKVRRGLWLRRVAVIPLKQRVAALTKQLAT